MIQEPAMSEPKERAWKKIVCFYALRMLFSSVCGASVLHAGKMDAGNLACAVGEEIGWRGVFVPGLVKVVGFARIGLITGLMWAFYHHPVLLFANYGAGAPGWYSATCFSIAGVRDSFIMAWLTLRAR